MTECREEDGVDEFWKKITTTRGEGDIIAEVLTVGSQIIFLFALTFPS